MNKYKLSMKTPSGLGTEYIYVESKYDNFERYLKEHNLNYQKQNFKTKQDKEIERLNNIIKEVREYIEEHIKYACDDVFNGMQFYSYHLYNFNKNKLLEILDKENKQ